MSKVYMPYRISSFIFGSDFKMGSQKEIVTVFHSIYIIFLKISAVNKVYETN
jgi:hypothetical protein